MANSSNLPDVSESGQPLAVSVADTVRLVGIGRTVLYEAIFTGALRILKVGRRRLVTIEALKEWLAECERNSNAEEVGDGRCRAAAGL